MPQAPMLINLINQLHANLLNIDNCMTVQIY